MEDHSQLINTVEKYSEEMEESMFQNNVKMEEQQLEMDEMTTEWLRIPIYVMEEPLLQQIPVKHVKLTMNQILIRMNESHYEVMG